MTRKITPKSFSDAVKKLQENQCNLEEYIAGFVEDLRENMAELSTTIFIQMICLSIFLGEEEDTDNYEGEYGDIFAYYKHYIKNEKNGKKVLKNRLETYKKLDNFFGDFDIQE